MPKLTGAQALIDCLLREGVDTVFGVPGGVLLPLYDAFYDSPIRNILARHEQGGAHMADGYARATGRVGVCIGTSGPGATNLITGIANANMDSIPIVALTGQVPSFNIGKDSFQEADTFGITLPVVKHNYLVKDPRDLSRVIHEAFHIASTGRPGPVVIDLPRDVTGGDFEYTPAEGPAEIRSYRPTAQGHPMQIARAAQLLNTSARPILYVGGGAIHSGCHEEVRQLAERLTIPTTTTLMGKGAFPETHPLSLGMLGMHGTAYANYAVHHCDLLVAIGARFDDRVTGKLQTFAPDAKIIHIDIDPAEIGKAKPADVPIVGDAKGILDAILAKVEPTDHSEWLHQIRQWKEEFPLQYREDGTSKPQQILRELHAVTGGRAIISTDVGQHQMWAAQYYLCDQPRHFLASGGLGTMGFGLPAAIGAQFGCPKETVACICGDGGFQMTLQEMIVAVEHRLPVKIILLNNGYLGMVRQWQQMFYQNRLSGVDISMQPDFVKLAEAYGAAGREVTETRDVRPALEWAMEIDDRPCLLNFRVAREENVFPMIPAGGSIDQMLID
ncbi:MAG TPA: biosynthetic-type acetolactate synthase large subunit [Armatimonadetes bacterium]|nr:biosynthetic-type acetolactate synthase large subunit [Armatimonadota bacterium]